MYDSFEVIEIANNCFPAGRQEEFYTWNGFEPDDKDESYLAFDEYCKKEREILEQSFCLYSSFEDDSADHETKINLLDVPEGVKLR